MEAKTMAENETVYTYGDYEVIEKSDVDPLKKDMKYGIGHKDECFFICHATNKIKAMHVCRALGDMEKLDMLAAQSYRSEGIRRMFNEDGSLRGE